jgi:hypothetical protein
MMTSTSCYAAHQTNRSGGGKASGALYEHNERIYHNRPRPQTIDYSHDGRLRPLRKRTQPEEHDTRRSWFWDRGELAEQSFPCADLAVK